MPFISVTRLHLTSWRYFPPFIFYSWMSSRQARRSPGFLAGWLGSDGDFGFWTCTVWESLEAMRAFRNCDVHLKAMPKLLGWCDQASYVHWEELDASVPDVETAFDRLSREGKVSKVNRPSQRQRGGETVSGAKPRGVQILKKTVA
jgi:hypothetical protein